MAFDENDVEPSVEEAGPPPEESGNRTFVILAAALGAILLLSLLCVAAYAFFVYPARKNANATAAAQAIAQSTEKALALKMTEQARFWTATPTKAPPTKTPLPPTNTPVVVVPTNTKLPPTTDPRTATVAALLTQAASAQKTTSPMPTSTLLPPGGFADVVGAPGMLAIALVLVAVIFLARRLRTAG